MLLEVKEELLERLLGALGHLEGRIGGSSLRAGGADEDDGTNEGGRGVGGRGVGCRVVARDEEVLAPRALLRSHSVRELGRLLAGAQPDLEDRDARH